MGFISDAADLVRSWWRQDKDSAPRELAKGDIFPRGRPADLFSIYGYDTISQYLKLDQDLLSRFVDYEEMDDYAEIASALDIYADDSTQPDIQTKRTLWVTSEDQTVQETVDDLMRHTLRAEEEAWSIARTLCKYGNNYEELLVTGEGVVGLNYLPPATVRRIEGPKGQTFGFIQDFRGKFDFTPEQFKQLLRQRYGQKVDLGGRDDGLIGTSATKPQYYGENPVMEDWEVAHFRLHSKHRRSTYGHSVLEPARWVYKRLLLLEDSALVYRLRRSPERRAFYVDVGDLPPREALAYVNQVRQQHRKKRFFNPSTGKLDLRYNPLSQDEDFYIPVRKGQEGSRIDVLQSPQWQSMDDIEYFKDKLWAAIKIPKAYLGQEEGIVRNILSSQDVRFARTILRVQRSLIEGFHKIGRVHLAAQNVDITQALFEIHMTVPSAIFELAQLEVLNARADLASRMREFVSIRWLLSEVFGMRDDEIEAIFKQRKEEADVQAKLDAEAERLRMQATEPPQEEVYTSPGKYIGREDGLRLLRNRGSGISEADLLRGSREAEKRAAEKLDKLLKNDRFLAQRLEETRYLVQELARAA